MIKQSYGKLVYVGCTDPSDRDFYGTPPEWIELSRKAMGGIELDPASCELANSEFVKADRFFDEESDGLSQSWACKTMFLNPPYSGKLKKQFASKFHDEWMSGNIGQAIVLVNNCTETEAFELLSACSTMRAETRGRIQFVGVDGRCNQNQNTRGQVFFYCGRRERTFARLFSKAGCRVIQEVKL